MSPAPSAANQVATGEVTTSGSPPVRRMRSVTAAAPAPRASTSTSPAARAANRSWSASTGPPARPPAARKKNRCWLGRKSCSATSSKPAACHSSSTWRTDIAWSALI